MKPGAIKSIAACALFYWAVTGFLSPSLAQNLAQDDQNAQLLARIADDQKRLNALISSDAHQVLYARHKAQCWLDFSRHEALRNNPTHTPREAQQQAARLVDALAMPDAQGITAEILTSDLPSTPVNSRKRPDLWNKLETLKSAASMRCTAKTVACAEVMLVQAAHTEQRIDWRYARPYFGMAQDMVQEAQTLAKNCQP